MYADTSVEKEGSIRCTVRCKTAKDMEKHVKEWHTKDGLERRRVKEQHMAEELTNAGYQFDRDWGNLLKFSDCPGLVKEGKFGRPDFRLLQIPSCEVFIEFDEKQHKGYTNSCEIRRMVNIYNTLRLGDRMQGVPCAFIRFNPDSYRIGRNRYDKKQTVRYKQLFDLLDRMKKGEWKPRNKSGLNVVYMFYDKDEKTGEPTLFQKLKDQPLLETARSILNKL